MKLLVNKSVKFLIKSNNMLTFPKPSNEVKAYENIQHLIMNKMSYDWNDVILNHSQN